MKICVTFSVPPGTPPQLIATLLTGQILEADGYSIDPRLGTLTVKRFVRSSEGSVVGHEDIVVYASGVWRSVADVGAFAAALPKEAPSESSRRR